MASNQKRARPGTPEAGPLSESPRKKQKPTAQEPLNKADAKPSSPVWGRPIIESSAKPNPKSQKPGPHSGGHKTLQGLKASRGWQYSAATTKSHFEPIFLDLTGESEDESEERPKPSKSHGFSKQTLDESATLLAQLNASLRARLRSTKNMLKDTEKHLSEEKKRADTSRGRLKGVEVKQHETEKQLVEEKQHTEAWRSKLESAEAKLTCVEENLLQETDRSKHWQECAESNSARLRHLEDNLKVAEEDLSEEEDRVKFWKEECAKGKQDAATTIKASAEQAHDTMKKLGETEEKLKESERKLKESVKELKKERDCADYWEEKCSVCFLGLMELALSDSIPVERLEVIQEQLRIEYLARKQAQKASQGNGVEAGEEMGE
ncbi:unnamed protein product [Discula destructiva]